MSPPDLEEMLSGDGRYEVSSLPKLEEFLQEQLSKGTYDLDVNLAILKLYLLFPDECKVEVMEGILLKALLAFPAADFSLCMYQIPEKYHQSFREVVQLAQQLEMAKFKSFWKMAAETEILNQVTGWRASVQKFIAGVVSATCRSIRSDELLELLDIKQPDLDKLVKERGWNRSKEDKQIIIVNTASFESKKVVVKEATNMTLDQYRSFFLASNAA
mmetsp:Transcript_80132/g.201608  ORF Transcript_80132/g.201608 Transcript_80132/m.201608 type:complete len:216 (+) Transcript_80132:73-720(+)